MVLTRDERGQRGVRRRAGTPSRCAVSVFTRVFFLPFLFLYPPSLALLCSSTELDRWTSEQLRIMTVGGNDAAAAFFREKGWTDLVAKVS